MIAKESRKHPRKPFFRTTRFGTQKGISEGTTKNISTSGVFIAISKNCGHTAERRMHAGNLINRFSRRGVEDMEVIEVEGQFYLLIRVHRPSSLAFSGYLQATDINVHIGFAT